MKWLKEWGILLIFAVILSAGVSIGIILPRSKTETVSDLPGVDITEYSVAGGGVQRVITFTGDGCTYEVVISEEP